MKLNELDDTIIQIIDSAIKSGDSSLLLACFRESSYLEKLDFIYTKLGEDISTFCTNLIENEVFITNTLRILSELIEIYGISDALCLCLSRTVLLLVTDENCPIPNIKNGIHVFNSLLQSPPIKDAIVGDESLEGSLQIFGRKIPTIGDYECQALLFEAIYRITKEENREYWANIWFPDAVARSFFLNLDPQKFESRARAQTASGVFLKNSRKALNYINRNELDRKVFSFPVVSIYIGSFKVEEPYDCDFFVDFNYGSQSISFFCSDFSELHEDSSQWETIIIGSSSVISYFIKDIKKERLKEVTLRLNCPFRTLTSSSITNPAFNSTEITLTFFESNDVYLHLEKVYGKDKSHNEASILQNHEISTLSEGEESIADDNVPEDNCMDNDPTSENRKVSNLSHAIPIPKATQIQSNGKLPQRKASVSVPISVDAYELEDFVPETNKKQKIRKISGTSEIIPISFEDILVENPKNHSSKKIYNSSELIQVETPKDDKVSDENRRISKGSPELSNQANEAGPVSKSQLKKIRLYNLESAPVYDVPPLSSSGSDHAKKTTSNAACSPVIEKSLINNSENTMNALDISNEEYRINKASSSRKKNSDEDKNIEVYDAEDSGDDFVENTNRNSTRRKSCLDNTPVNRPSTSERKCEASKSLNNQRRGYTRPRREAAIKASELNKNITYSSPSVYDRIDELDNVSDKSEGPSQKKIRRPKVFTDTETGSSEVSWLKPKRKRVSLFQTPTKTYAELRRNRQAEEKEQNKQKKKEKKKLPVEIVSKGLPITSTPLHPRLRESSSKRGKKKIENPVSKDSELKALRFSMSQFKDFDLTIEKSNTHHTSREIECVSKNLSHSSHEKNLQLSSNLENSHQNSSMRNTETLQQDTLRENNIQEDYDQNEFNIQDDLSDHYKGCKTVNERTTSKPENIHSNPEIKAPETENESSSLRKKGTGSEKAIQSRSELSYNDNSANDDDSVDKILGLKAEAKGKQFILEHFLKSTVEYYENLKDNISLLNHGSESSRDCNTRSPIANKEKSYKSSIKRKSTSLLHSSSPKRQRKSKMVNNKNKEKEDECECVSEIHDQCKEIISDLRKKVEKTDKSKAHIPSTSSTKQKKQKHLHVSENSNESQGFAVNQEHTKSSQNFKGCAIDDLCLKLDAKVSKNLGSANTKVTAKRKSFDSVSVQLSDSEKSSRKNKKFKSVGDNSSSSSHSKQTSKLSQETECDEEWFKIITLKLSEKANASARMLLGTVQKCFFEYSAKMSALRKNIVKAARALEKSPDPESETHKIKGFVKDCKVLRREIKSSLKQMHITGMEYFETEEKQCKILRKKHMKASKKYILRMQQAEEDAVQKMEHEILLKAKKVLKDFVKHIDSA